MVSFKKVFKNKWKIATFVLILLLVVSVFTNGLGLQRLVKSLSAKKVASNTINFINKNLLSEGVKATLVSVSAKENGLYEVKIKVSEKEYDTYVSSDGKLLFLSAISLVEDGAQATESTTDSTK